MARAHLKASRLPFLLAATESNAEIIEANAETRMETLEDLLGDEGISAAYSNYFVVAP